MTRLKYLSSFQNINRIITQMQSIEFCVWVFFLFCHAQQIIRGYPIELCQRHNAKGANALKIVVFIFAQCQFGKTGLLRKLFQR